MIFAKGTKVIVASRSHSQYNKIGFMERRNGDFYSILFVEAGKMDLVEIHKSDLRLASIKHDFLPGMAVVVIDRDHQFYLRQGTLVSISKGFGFIDIGYRQTNILGESHPVHISVHLEDLEPVTIPQPGNRKGLRSK